MSTPPRSLRRGLPRVPGGEPWPPAGDTGVSAEGAESVAAGPGSEPSVTVAASEPATATIVPAGMRGPSGAPRTLRRGLPRVPGGEPWPPQNAVTAPVAAGPAPAVGTGAAPSAASVSLPPEAPERAADAGGGERPAPTATGGGIAVRRGLPRVAGGEPWPPAETVRPAAAADAAPAAGRATVGEPVTADAPPPDETGLIAAPAGPTGLRPPLPFVRTVWAGAAATGPRGPEPEPERIGPFTGRQWAGAALLGGIVLVIAAGMAVALVRWMLSTDPLQAFLLAYPGEYHLPESAPVGIPAWLGWQHFLNTFFLLLIVRTGLQVRRDKRPGVFWSPRGNPKRKISLSLWFHQSLDIIWVANGVVFVVLLFVTGQWVRIVPTSWEVFPNALSAALQYVSLDWPTENGWVNYNSLQQLAYFATVFLAAPLAILSGVRMSGIWPTRAGTLNRLYPLEWARRTHFPVMLYFVAFTAVHVALVFATGALRNLNHMYAAQGSTDPEAYADNWAGFWIFLGSAVVIAVTWIAARPLVLAPIARLFGTVKGR